MSTKTGKTYCPHCGKDKFFKAVALMSGLQIDCTCGKQFYTPVSKESLAAFTQYEYMKIKPKKVSPRMIQIWGESAFELFMDQLSQTALGRIAGDRLFR